MCTGLWKTPAWHQERCLWVYRVNQFMSAGCPVGLVTQFINFSTLPQSITLIANFLISVPLKKFWQSVNIWPRYVQEYGLVFPSFIWLTVCIVYPMMQKLTVSLTYIPEQFLQYCRGLLYILVSLFAKKYCSSKQYKKTKKRRILTNLI